MPAPSIVRVGLHGDGAVYEITFTVATSDRMGDGRNEVYAEIQRHLRHAGIALAVKGLASVPALRVPTVADLVEQSDLFGLLDAPQRDLLAKRLEEAWFDAGDVLIFEGDVHGALFVVASGTVEIAARPATGPAIVHRMGPGGTLGAIGLITGTPYAATATALTQTKAFRLEKQAIANAIAEDPELASGLEALACRGQAAMKRDLAARADDVVLEPTEMFLKRMRSFLLKLAVGDRPEAVP